MVYASKLIGDLKRKNLPYKVRGTYDDVLETLKKSGFEKDNFSIPKVFEDYHYMVTKNYDRRNPELSVSVMLPLISTFITIRRKAIESLFPNVDVGSCLCFVINESNGSVTVDHEFGPIRGLDVDGSLAIKKYLKNLEYKTCKFF